MTAASALPLPSACAAPDGAPALSLVTDLSVIEPGWRQLEATATGAPFQRFDVVAAMLAAHPGAAPLVVVDGPLDRPRMILALAVHRLGPLRVARYPGGRHAPVNLPLFDRAAYAAAGPETLDAIRAALKPAGIDLLHLTGQPLEHLGRPNPLVGPAPKPACHGAYDLSLDGGFDAVLSRHKGKKKRQRQAHRLRGFDPVGGARLVHAETAERGLAIFETFLQQKAARFAAQGLPDAFAAPAIRGVFRRLIRAGVGSTSPILDVYALEAGGTIRSTAFTLPFDGRMSLLMNSFADDDLARFAPGEILHHWLIEDACRRGFARFDFGVGKARYKDSWADREIALADSVIPLSRAGRLAAAGLSAAADSRRWAAGNPALRQILQRLRRSFGPKTVPEANGDDP